MSRTVEDDKHMPWKLIVFSILLGVFFSILPFPYWALWLIPEVPLLIIIYWVITFPFRFGMIISGLIGLLIDVLDGGILGQNALAFIVISYL
jgi:rod shape-determining protein MreD